MAYQITTTQQNIDKNIAFMQARLNQEVPVVDKAYTRVVSIIFGTVETSITKLSVERALQCLALTATGENLDNLGKEYGVIRKAAEAAVLTGTIPTTAEVTLPQSYSFTGENNSVIYFPNASYTSVANVITATVTSEELGISGNLNIGDTMVMSSPLAGASSTLTVTEIVTVGAPQETDDAYRQRILTEIRTVKGGGNSADYRKWSEEVSGVLRTFPYAGLPITDPGVSAPPDRVVYVEATTEIDSDGIPPQSLLDTVRAHINQNQETGQDREPLGLVNERLYVEPIVRDVLYYEVRGLTVSAPDEASVKADIESALSIYSRLISPYVDGLDFEADRNDIVTDPLLSAIVQNIVADVGGSLSGVAFGLAPGVNIPSYQLEQNQLVKSGGVTYVA
jgi:phage-related baseplate assembly protein